MRRSVFRDLLLASTLLLSPLISASHASAAENRLALVIGQSAYRAVPALPNAENDGKRMAELLTNSGFQVTAAPDLSQTDMRQAISDFAAKVAASGPDTVAAVFYAGHGLQIDGENYLVPVDVDPKREADIPLQAVRLNDLMNTLGALPTRMRIYMLDACRNNPFPALNGTAGHGLAIVDTKAGAPGSFISFSTSPGSEAEDGNGDDSPYTTALLSVAKQPNVPIEEAFKRVRVAVNQATDGRQVPWESSSLTADFKFVASDTGQGADQGAAATTKPPSAPVKSADDWRRDLKGKEPKAAYDLVIADDTTPAYEAFTALFAQSTYTPRVRSLLERRREMEAWENAVAVNTAASFEAFLSTYGSSDLAATARKMEERVRNRSLAANASLIQPTNVALGPTCPCNITPAPAPALKKKVDKEDTPPPVKHVNLPVKRVAKSTPKRRPPPDEVVVVQQPSGPPPGVVMEGVGIGIGMGMGGGMGGGMGRGGGMGMGGGGMRPGRY
jgi:Caspase domain